MRFLSVSGQLLLIFALMWLFVPVFSGEAQLSQEQHEVTLTLQVFGFTDGKSAKYAIPIEDAHVQVNPSTKVLREPELSYREREEAEATFYERGRTDENGMISFDLSDSLHYFNTTWYEILVSARLYYGEYFRLNVTKTREVTIFLKEYSPALEAIYPPVCEPSGLTSFCAPALFIASIVATSVTVAWILKRKYRKTNDGVQ